MNKFKKYWEKFTIASRLKYLWTIKGELALGTLALILFFKVIGWMQGAGLAVGGLDEGILHFLVLSIVGVVISVIVAFTVINFAWTEMDDYIDGKDEDDNSIDVSNKVSFKRDWKKVSPTVRVVATLTTWSVLFIGFIVALALAL
jgi:uncharacterized transporter YbjL